MCKTFATVVVSGGGHTNKVVAIWTICLLLFGFHRLYLCASLAQFFDDDDRSDGMGMFANVLQNITGNW